eukprot:jgi/Hompol1/2325/HPOL_005429-RA
MRQSALHLAASAKCFKNIALDMRIATHLAARSLSSQSSDSATTNSNKPFYVTSPIFYVNAVPHIGHLYSAIQEAAAMANTDPKTFCDGISEKFKVLFDQSNVAFSRFIRTTDTDHQVAVTHLWERLVKNGYIYKGYHEGWYCISDETFYPETQVEPSPTKKDVMISKETGKVVEWTKEENYKFRLSAFKDRLIAWLEETPDIILPESQYNLVLSMLKQGDLADLSVSRLKSRLRWGISVPNDDTHVIYVWLDALTNYLTVTGYPWKNVEPGSPDEAQVAAQHGWPADIHIVGKDIIKFHSIYWPAFLMAADLPTPRRIVSHGHWLINQQKMSKSTGNVVDPHELLSKYGTDPVRYFLLRDGSISIDPEFSHTVIEARYTSTLAGQLGNLVSRASGKRINPTGVIPKSMGDCGDPDLIDLVEKLGAAPAIVDAHFNAVNLPLAIETIEKLIGGINQYWGVHEPWHIATRTDPASQSKLSAILYVTYETLRVAALLLLPIMPTKASQLLDQLGVDPTERYWDNVGV